jgi:glutaredoxin
MSSNQKLGVAFATLYLMRVKMSPKVIANIKTARRLLKKIGISGKRIKEIDLTTNLALQDKILRQITPNSDFPIIFIDNQLIGVSALFS